MNRFIQRENLRLLRERLARTTDAAKCRRIVQLIEEEEMKGRAAAGGRAQSRTSGTFAGASKGA
jgi:hypothetical protein